VHFHFSFDFHEIRNCREKYDGWETRDRNEVFAFVGRGGDKKKMTKALINDSRSEHTAHHY